MGSFLLLLLFFFFLYPEVKPGVSDGSAGVSFSDSPFLSLLLFCFPLCLVRTLFLFFFFFLFLPTVHSLDLFFLQKILQHFSANRPFC